MEDIIPELIKFRRHLHQYPELSSQEKKSSSFILESVKDCHPDQIVEFDNYGIAVIFKGKNEGRNMLVRGDFVRSFSDLYILKWSVWWALAMCGNFQVKLGN